MPRKKESAIEETAQIELVVSSEESGETEAEAAEEAVQEPEKKPAKRKRTTAKGVTGSQAVEETAPTEPENKPAKKKRSTAKAATETKAVEEADPPEPEKKPTKKKSTPTKKDTAPEKAEPVEETASVFSGDSEEKAARPKKDEKKPLAIDRSSGNLEETLRAALDWRDIQVGARKGRVCTGIFSGIERISDASEVAVIDYKGCRVLIPLEEMISQKDFSALKDEPIKIRRRITQMLGAEVEFVMMGVDQEAHTIVGSRQKAMEKKVEDFYFTDGPNRIVKGRVVEARIVAVGRLSVRLEVFGVETTVSGLNLSWEWSPDLREKYRVSDRVFVRVKDIYGDEPEKIGIVCEGRSVSSNPDEENLARCSTQSRYLGTVVNLRNSAILVRLSNGVNGIATGCVSERFPATGDEVCFLVTKIHRDEGVVRGLITRVIRKAH